MLLLVLFCCGVVAFVVGLVVLGLLCLLFVLSWVFLCCCGWWAVFVGWFLVVSCFCVVFVWVVLGFGFVGCFLGGGCVCFFSFSLCCCVVFGFLGDLVFFLRVFFCFFVFLYKIRGQMRVGYVLWFFGLLFGSCFVFVGLFCVFLCCVFGPILWIVVIFLYKCLVILWCC